MRYDRQLDVFGKDGQSNIEGAHVAVAGCGGLGCKVATQLALAGVGRFTLIDFDTVSETDLNRQFVHCGKTGKKTESLKEWISEISGCEVESIDGRLTEKNVRDFVGDADIVVDCLDNNESRLILNDGIVEKKVPLVHGGTNSMRGQVTFISPGRTPCLACFLGKDGKDNSSVGAAVSAVASIQAAEALKYIAGRGELLECRMLSIDLSKNLYEIYDIERNPKCGRCSRL